ncbi:dTDP-4-dehydrorhamnose reductase [Paraburkholderia gardini]|uniref:dTDP-4-dehydrorhamnose reductase n=1 Tax=Paraburkholderia gardini TaxID=2823469 RepID=UPI001DD86FDC|nr:dTDP-4-dehydrorhamnose reductase [Paraburkholderia gardini]CAG4904743.1 dTDP-4-dehydrorhamnose reductase [Paraburkholderia gardini]
MTTSPDRTLLVTGSTGQVGFELVRSLQGLGRIVAPHRHELDLTNPDDIRRVVRMTKPALIINAAAYTAVDLAEDEEGAAQRINGDAPEILAEEARQVNAVLIHFSTDYVFDGTKSSPYVETDAPNPQNVYGRSKLAGEEAIVASRCAHLILRTSWVYGTRGKNFLLTMQRLGAQQRELRVVADQTGAPTWSRAIAVATTHIVSQGIASSARNHEWWDERSGIYHLTSRGATSWAGFAEAIFDAEQREFRPGVIPILSSEYPTRAQRPANSILSNKKISSIFGLNMENWQDALRLCLEIS